MTDPSDVPPPTTPDTVHLMAPWGRRRGRLVGAGLAIGSLVLAAAFVAMLWSTPSAAFGFVLAAAMLVLGLGLAWWIGRTSMNVRLEMGDWGVRYQAPLVRIEARWEDVVAVDQVLRGSETGPALVLAGDRATGDRGLLGVIGIAGALDGSGVARSSVGSTIPLAAFIEGRFVGSPVERDLRRYVPALVDGYVLRYPALVR